MLGLPMYKGNFDYIKNLQGYFGVYKKIYSNVI